jgi:hypothetical protein
MGYGEKPLEKQLRFSKRTFDFLHGFLKAVLSMLLRFLRAVRLKDKAHLRQGDRKGCDPFPEHTSLSGREKANTLHSGAVMLAAM